MILRYHRKPVTFDEVRKAIYKDRTGVPNASDVVEAAERFLLHMRGLAQPVTFEEVLQAIRKDHTGVLKAADIVEVTEHFRLHMRDLAQPVTIEEVLQAMLKDRTGVPNALDIVEAAERFGLRVRGLAVDDPMVLESIPTPNIAHMMRVRGQFPRSLEEGLAAYFAVVVSISQHSVHWIDPYVGQIDDEPDAFCEFASGIFLVFDEAAPLPRARLRPVASDG